MGGKNRDSEPTVKQEIKTLDMKNTLSSINRTYNYLNANELQSLEFSCSDMKLVEKIKKNQS